MDEKSLELLEFPEIRKRIANYASFSASRELALALAPVADFEKASLWLRQSAEARRFLELNPGFTIGQASDIRELAATAAIGKVLEPVNLLEIARTLAILRQVRKSLAETSGSSEPSSDIPLLREIAGRITELPSVEVDINHCISQSGEVLDRASANLAGVRRQLADVRQQLREKLEALIRQPETQKIIQEPIITEREGRYVIPVKTELRKEISGITHDVSNTGATAFIEPVATIELGNTVRELVSEERREVERILRGLSESVGVNSAEIAASVAGLAELDLVMAKARYGRAVKATEAALFPSRGKDAAPPFIKLSNARHPLLGPKAVPLSIEIGEDFSILVITGPNTGGKTVALKTIGLLVLMTQAGIPVPAAPETSFPIFDNVFADIGDEQSIEHTLSSFTWHMQNIVRIVKNATPRSLVLLDELGKSTDPAEGSALARAVLLHLQKSSVLAVATTHYGDVKVFAHSSPGFQNASFDFDPVTFVPTYRLTLGIPGGSNALATAERIGLPPAIIQEARSMMSQGVLAFEETLADIMAEKRKVEGLAEQLRKERLAAETEKTTLRERVARLEFEERRAFQEERDRVVRDAAELQKLIRDARTELRKKRTRDTVEAARKTIADVHGRLDAGVWSSQASQVGAVPAISVGDTVYLRENNLRGTVTAVNEKAGEVEMLAGHVRLRVSIASVDKVTPAGRVPMGAPGRSSVSTTGIGQPGKVTVALKKVATELDLRGKRAEEVEPAVDAYLNDASLSNLNEVLIIHGLATGTVRQITRDFLAGHPLVKSFRSGTRAEGGEGTTVVTL